MKVVNLEVWTEHIASGVDLHRVISQLAKDPLVFQSVYNFVVMCLLYFSLACVLSGTSFDVGIIPFHLNVTFSAPNHRKEYAPHDTECPYWDHVSLNIKLHSDSLNVLVVVQVAGAWSRYMCWLHCTIMNLTFHVICWDMNPWPLSQKQLIPISNPMERALLCHTQLLLYERNVFKQN